MVTHQVKLPYPNEDCGSPRMGWNLRQIFLAALRAHPMELLSIPQNVAAYLRDWFDRAQSLERVAGELCNTQAHNLAKLARELATYTDTTHSEAVAKDVLDAFDATKLTVALEDGPMESWASRLEGLTRDPVCDGCEQTLEGLGCENCGKCPQCCDCSPACEDCEAPLNGYECSSCSSCRECCSCSHSADEAEEEDVEEEAEAEAPPTKSNVIDLNTVRRQRGTP